MTSISRDTLSRSHDIFQKDQPRNITPMKTAPHDVNPPLHTDNIKIDELRKLMLGI